MPGQRIVANKVVQFVYIITDEEGNLIERVDKPVNYIHGAGSLGLSASIEHALEGRTVGDTIEITLPAVEGFGERDPNLTFTDKINSVPTQFQQLGAQVQMTNEAGETKAFIVTKIENDEITFDGNHPLAGKSARFIIRIVAIRDATAQELENNLPDSSSHTLH